MLFMVFIFSLKWNDSGYWFNYCYGGYNHTTHSLGINGCKHVSYRVKRKKATSQRLFVASSLYNVYISLGLHVYVSNYYCLILWPVWQFTVYRWVIWLNVYFLISVISIQMFYILSILLFPDQPRLLHTIPWTYSEEANQFSSFSRMWFCAFSAVAGWLVQGNVCFYFSDWQTSVYEKYPTFETYIYIYWKGLFTV